MFQSYQLSGHAHLRCSQRKIQPQILGLVIEQGHKVFQASGRIRHRINEFSECTRQNRLVVVTDAEKKVVITTWRENRTKLPKRYEKKLYIPLTQNHLLGQFSPEDWEEIQFDG